MTVVCEAPAPAWRQSANRRPFPGRSTLNRSHWIIRRASFDFRDWPVHPGTHFYRDQPESVDTPTVAFSMTFGSSCWNPPHWLMVIARRAPAIGPPGTQAAEFCSWKPSRTGLYSFQEPRQRNLVGGRAMLPGNGPTPDISLKKLTFSFLTDRDRFQMELAIPFEIQISSSG